MDLLMFGIAVAGASVVVLLAYLVVRRGLGPRTGAAGISAAAAVTVAIALTAELTMGGLEIVERHSRPMVSFGPYGLSEVDPAFLGGNYLVRWSAVSGLTLCHLEAHLLRSGDPSFLDVLANATVGESANIGGGDEFLALLRGEYYVDAVTDCATWSVVLTPTP